MLKIYEQLAEESVKVLWENRLDLDRFLPALMKAMQDQIRLAKESPDDYDPEELNYAANQERDVKLFIEGLGDALGELGTVERYGENSTDHIDMGHIRSAIMILRNLKRRVDFV